MALITTRAFTCNLVCRYYRVMVTGVDRRAEDAQHAAKAFRLVAQAWLEMRAEACLAAASICALDIMVLGGIWYVCVCVSGHVWSGMCVCVCVCVCVSGHVCGCVCVYSIRVRSCTSSNLCLET